MTDQPQQPQQPEQREPTQEEHEQVQAVGAAGVEAVQKGEDPKSAMRQARDKSGSAITDEQIEEIAEKFFGRFETMLRESGALDPPVEPVKPPEPAIAPAAPGESAPTSTPDQAPQVPTINKPSWAAKFIGDR